MKKIKLTQGQYAIVDDVDYDWLNQYKWFADKSHSGTFYAARRTSLENGKQYSLHMSRQILGLEYRDKRQADHQNHNTLDNRHHNLRICTNRQNAFNQKTPLNSSSRFKGVTWHKQCKKWQANIRVNGEQEYLGLFDMEVFAALAYNSAAKKYFGEFACLNQI